MDSSHPITRLFYNPLILAAILGVGFLVNPSSASAQGIGPVDPSCPPPMVIEGGTCTVATDPSTNPYTPSGQDSDGDGIDDPYDPCPNDDKNECPTVELFEEIDENKCNLTAAGLIIGSVFAGPGAPALVVAGTSLGVACNWE